MPIFKKLRQVILALSILVSTHYCHAQEENNDLGQFSSEEKNMKECSFDKRADAVILLDHAVAYFNDDYNLITEHRIRIKILKEKGIERGDITIPFYSEDKFELIRDVKAVVLTRQDNGEFVTSVLERKNIFQR